MPTRDVPVSVCRQVLQRDIESHGRIVSSVVKLGERVAAGLNRCSADGQENQHHQQQQQQQQALRVASSLERRWHLLFLRALEWQCHIETLASRVRSKVSCSLGVSPVPCRHACINAAFLQREEINHSEKCWVRDVCVVSATERD